MRPFYEQRRKETRLKREFDSFRSFFIKRFEIANIREAMGEQFQKLVRFSSIFFFLCKKTV